MKTVESIREEIKALISYEGECWIWKGDMLEGTPIFKRTTAARAAYNAFMNPLPKGTYLYRHCPNSRCVYPGHFHVGKGWKGGQANRPE